MNIEEFQRHIAEAYRTTNRTPLWLTAALVVEAAELSELVVKGTGYGELYSQTDVLSEAGDILNFLTAFLQTRGLTLEEAMYHNIHKLKTRGWI